MPSYATPSLPPPWNPGETPTKDLPSAVATSDMATTERTEMVQALRTAFPDAKSMPDDVKKFIDKYEVQNSKQITTEMHRATTTMGKARKTLHGLLDAKAKHRTAWLRHLRALLETLQKQVDAFETQQKDYQDRINAARREVQTSRRTLQRKRMWRQSTSMAKTELSRSKSQFCSTSA